MSRLYFLGNLKGTNLPSILHSVEAEIVSKSLAKSLMILFLHTYGWRQLEAAPSLNPIKTFRSVRQGGRMIYDAHIEAIAASKFCRHKWLRIFC